MILSAFDDDAFVRAALDAGATGYLLKTMPPKSSWARCGPPAREPRSSTRLLSSRLAGTPIPRSASSAPRLTWRERRDGRARGRRALQQGDRGAPRSGYADGRGPPEPRLRQAGCGVTDRVGSLRLDQRPDLLDPFGRARARAAFGRGQRSGGVRPSRAPQPWTQPLPGFVGALRASRWSEGQSARAEDAVALVAEVPAPPARQLLRAQHRCAVPVHDEAPLQTFMAALPLVGGVVSSVGGDGGPVPDGR